MRHLTVVASQHNVVMPNGRIYQGGNTVVLTDAHWALVDPDLLDRVLIDNGVVADATGASPGKLYRGYWTATTAFTTVGEVTEYRGEFWTNLVVVAAGLAAPSRVNTSWALYADALAFYGAVVIPPVVPMGFVTRTKFNVD